MEDFTQLHIFLTFPPKFYIIARPFRLTHEEGCWEACPSEGWVLLSLKLCDGPLSSLCLNLLTLKMRTVASEMSSSQGALSTNALLPLPSLCALLWLLCAHTFSSLASSGGKLTLQTSTSRMRPKQEKTCEFEGAWHLTQPTTTPPPAPTPCCPNTSWYQEKYYFLFLLHS